ncbi:MAG: hypothetical protein ACYT04_44415 [Nostoc sp.]
MKNNHELHKSSYQVKGKIIEDAHLSDKCSLKPQPPKLESFSPLIWLNRLVLY